MVVRLEKDAIENLDEVIAEWPDPDARPSRSELIRIIVADWIKANWKK